MIPRAVGQLVFGPELRAFEIKLSASPTIDDLERLNRVANLIGASRRFLVSQTAKVVETFEAAGSRKVDWGIILR